MKRHIKRYAAPATWHIERKTTTFIKKPSPGSHAIIDSMSLATWLIQLGLAKTQKEVRFILKTKKVLVDEKRVKNPALPVGSFDSLSIPEAKLFYVVQLDTKGKLCLISGSSSEKVCKILGKKTMGKEYQLSLSGGRTAKTTNNNYHVHDSITLKLPAGNIVKHLALEPGASILLMKGKHVGNKGVVERVDGQKVWCKLNDASIETRKKLICVIP